MIINGEKIVKIEIMSKPYYNLYGCSNCNTGEAQTISPVFCDTEKKENTI